MAFPWIFYRWGLTVCDPYHTGEKQQGRQNGIDALNSVSRNHGSFCTS
jgi:hypothetical protein